MALEPRPLPPPLRPVQGATRSAIDGVFIHNPFAKAQRAPPPSPSPPDGDGRRVCLPANYKPASIAISFPSPRCPAAPKHKGSDRAQWVVGAVCTAVCILRNPLLVDMPGGCRRPPRAGVRRL